MRGDVCKIIVSNFLNMQLKDLKLLNPIGTR